MHAIEQTSLSKDFENNRAHAYKELKKSILNAHGKDKGENHSKQTNVDSNQTLVQKDNGSIQSNKWHDNKWADVIRQNVANGEEIVEATNHKADKTKDVEFVFKMAEGQFPQMIMRNTAVDGQRQETVVKTEVLSEIQREATTNNNNSKQSGNSEDDSSSKQ